MSTHSFESVQKVVDLFVESFPSAEWSPAHIVLSDYNFDDNSIKYCLKQVNAGINGEHDSCERYTSSELYDIRAFLLFLLEIPEDDRLTYAD